MKILILGGNGFLGSNLAQFLKNKGYSVTCFDIVYPQKRVPGIQYVKGNFFDETDLIPYLQDAEVVFHAISTINPGNSNVKYMFAYSNDFLQSVKLAQFSKEYAFKLIYFSSGGTVYGNQDVQPIKETATSIPINHYGNIKLCIENTYRTFNRQIGTNIIIARIANPYGPGQDYTKGVGFVDAAIKKAISHDVLQVYGDGSVIRDYIYIEDVCGMLEKLIGYSGQNEVFNLGTGVGVSQKEVIKIVKDIVGILDVNYVASRAIDVPCVILDNYLMSELYEEKCVDIYEGIKKYYCSIISC